MQSHQSHRCLHTHYRTRESYRHRTRSLTLLSGCRYRFEDSQRFEPPHDKTNKMICVPSEDSDQPGHLASLVSVFAVRMKKAWVLSYPLSAQRRLRSDWVDAQADPSLHWAHSHFVGFIMRWLILTTLVLIYSFN